MYYSVTSRMFTLKDCDVICENSLSPRYVNNDASDDT